MLAMASLAIVGGCSVSLTPPPRFGHLPRAEKRRFIAHNLVLDYCSYDPASPAQQRGCIAYVNPQHIRRLSTPAARHARHQIGDHIHRYNERVAACQDPNNPVDIPCPDQP